MNSLLDFSSAHTKSTCCHQRQLRCMQLTSIQMCLGFLSVSYCSICIDINPTCSSPSPDAIPHIGVLVVNLKRDMKQLARNILYSSSYISKEMVVSLDPRKVHCIFQDILSLQLKGLVNLCLDVFY